MSASITPAAEAGYVTGNQYSPPERRRAWTPGSGPRRVALGLLLPVSLLALWQAAVSAGVFSAAVFPGPGAVLRAAVDLAERGLLQQYVAISTQRVVLGFAIGATAGLVLGALVGLSRLADALLGPTLAGVRAVPSLAWVPLLLLYLGIYETPKVTLIAIGAFFPVYTTVAGALRHVDPHLVELGRAFGLRGPALLRTVQMPAAIPSLISGLRLALAQSWLFLVAAELIAASQGIGYLMVESSNNGRVDRIFLAILCLALLGVLSDVALRLFERWALRRWA